MRAMWSQNCSVSRHTKLNLERLLWPFGGIVGAATD
jgi:hypothetical protein